MKNAVYIAAGVAGLLAVYVLTKKRPGESFAGAAGRTIGGGVADAGAGVVVGLGGAVGIPQTNVSKCQQDMAAGRTWAASFSCDATTFAKYLMGKPGSENSNQSIAIGAPYDGNDRQTAVYPAQITQESKLDDLRNIERRLEREALYGPDQQQVLTAIVDPYTGEQIGQYDEMGNRIN